MDVVAINPHISHEKGFNSNAHVPMELVDLAKTIFENNYFEFYGKMYRQKLETPICTKFAPAFENIFVSDLEIDMLINITFIRGLGGVFG